MLFRSRYEVNNVFRGRLEEKGLVFCGTSPDGGLVEALELRDHPWFVAVQSHPEFQSKPTRPHPLFRDFIGAAIEHRQRRMEGALGGRGQEAHSESVHSAASKL